MLKRGEMELAYYHVDLDALAPQPESIQIQAYYIGVTNWLELYAQRMAVDKDMTSVVLVGSLRLMSETPTKPDLVFGCRNMGGTPTTNNPPFSPINYRANSANQSYYLCAAKTFFFDHDAHGRPKPPLIRLHASLGTPNWTVGLAERQKGIFGGAQALITPYLGALALYDGQDMIAGAMIRSVNTGLELRAGKFGDRWYVGLALDWPPPR